jgi:NAD(P)-dependent dehydrogenase (short-subunit alcohol dehydrogenase family)
VNGSGRSELVSEGIAGKGRVTVVTGAGGGIGGAIVRRLATDGMTVAAVDVRPIKPRSEGTTFRYDISDLVRPQQGDRGRLCGDVRPCELHRVRVRRYADDA